MVTPYNLGRSVCSVNVESERLYKQPERISRGLVISYPLQIYFNEAAWVIS